MRTTRAISGAMRAAWAVLRHNRWRSFLTLTICGLGTAGVILAGSVGQAHLGELENRLNALGGRLVVVSPNKLPPYPGRPRQLDHFISLEPEDALAIAERIPDLKAVVPGVARNTTLRRDGHASRIRLVGTNHDYLKVRGFSLSRGRFLQSGDEGQRVIVLGQGASRELNPLGVQPGGIVLLGGHPYEVIGIVEPQGVNFAGEDEDHQAFIPLDTYRSATGLAAGSGRRRRRSRSSRPRRPPQSPREMPSHDRRPVALARPVRAVRPRLLARIRRRTSRLAPGRAAGGPAARLAQSGLRRRRGAGTSRPARYSSRRPSRATGQRGCPVRSRPRSACS